MLMDEGMSATGDPRGEQQVAPDENGSLTRGSTIDSGDREQATDDMPDDVADPQLCKQVLAGLFQHRRSELEKIDRFPILSRLGEGGMGVVYSSYDEELDRRIALKLVRRRGQGGEDTDTKRLQREARAMAKLVHPNVVQVFQAGPFEGGTFIAMEFVRGQTLADWLAREPRPWQDVVEVFVQAGRALAAAHAAGIVHRDFKPANAMIDAQGVVKVLDFGLARTPGMGLGTGEGSLDTGASLDERLTRTGAMMGTPAYMAPEQIEARGANEKSDQFSFCVALYQGLYGQLPFPTSSLMELMAAVRTGQMIPPPRGHKVPPWVQEIVMRGLAVDPEQRHPNMEALLDALQRDPVARRRRRVGLGVAFCGIGLLGFAVAPLLNPPQETPTCEDTSAAIAEVWSPARRATLEAALVGTGVVYAGEVWERSAAQLDDYAKDWADMRREACETHLAARQSDALFDQRSACLDRRLVGLQALLEQLEQADADMVEKLPTAIAHLPPISFCGDTEALTADVRPPEDPAVAAEVKALREQIARAQAHESLGRYDQGLALIEGVVARAKQLDYAPLEAEALLQRGYLQQQHGATSQETLDSLQAAELRAIASNHPEIIAAAMSRAMLLRGTRVGEVERALEDGPRIAAELERIPHARGLRGVFLNDEAELLRLNGENERAIDGFERSLEIKRAAFGARHVEVAFTLANLAWAYVEQGDYQRADALLEESIAIRVETLGARHPMTVKTMGTRAEVLLAQGCIAEARALVEQTLAILAETDAMSSTLALFPLSAAAQLQLEERNFARAREIMGLALSTAEALDAEIWTMVYQQRLGEIELDSGAVERGLELYERAFTQINETLGEGSPFALDALRQLSDAQRKAGHVELALEYAERALVGFEASGEELEIRSALLTLGRAQAQAGRLEQALDSFTRALEHREARGADPDLERARVEVEKGRVQLDLGRASDAKETLEHALAALTGTCEGDTFELAMLRFDLARALLDGDTPDPERARQLAAQAARALAELGPAFAVEAEKVEAWRGAQGWGH